MYVCMYVCTYVCMHAYMYVHTYACVHMHLLGQQHVVAGQQHAFFHNSHIPENNITKHVCMYVCMYVGMYVCMYVYICKPNFPFPTLFSRLSLAIARRDLSKPQLTTAIPYVCTYVHRGSFNYRCCCLTGFQLTLLI